MRHRSTKKVVIRRQDIKKIHDYAHENSGLRDFLLVRLPMQIGLRTSEIRTLKIENIDFDNRRLYVLDSKEKKLYLLPVDMLTLQLMKDLAGARTKGYLFRQKRSWKYKKSDEPLTKSRIWQIIHRIAEAAGVLDVKPRTLRQYFAYNWARVEKKSVVGLQEMLRHADLGTTEIYINSRFTTWEDLQKEFDSEPLAESHEALSDFSLTANYQKWCSKCDHEHLCKFIEQFCGSEYADSCRHFTIKEQIIKKVTV